MNPGFGGPRETSAPPIQLPQRAPDITCVEKTSASQALIYRLSGDYNPLHVDPEISSKLGFERPIMHGLCTFAMAARVVVREVCSGNQMMIRLVD